MWTNSPSSVTSSQEISRWFAAILRIVPAISSAVGAVMRSIPVRKSCISSKRIIWMTLKWLTSSPDTPFKCTCAISRMSASAFRSMYSCKASMTPSSTTEKIRIQAIAIRAYLLIRTALTSPRWPARSAVVPLLPATSHTRRHTPPRSGTRRAERILCSAGSPDRRGHIPPQTHSAWT